MKNNFNIGDKVVCINNLVDEFSNSYLNNQLQKNEIYTVKFVDTYRIVLNEISIEFLLNSDRFILLDELRLNKLNTIFDGN